jgi:hypothetical protein
MVVKKPALSPVMHFNGALAFITHNVLAIYFCHLRYIFSYPGILKTGTGVEGG